MHTLQPKHAKLKADEVTSILTKYNISISQLPRIKVADPATPEGCNPGDVLKIERKDNGETAVYFRVVA